MADRYTRSVTVEMADIVDTYLKQKSVSPVIALATDDGVLFATSSAIPGFEKVMSFHRGGLYLGAAGEAAVINNIKMQLINRAHALELAGGIQNASLERVVVAEQIDGSLAWLRMSFHNPETVPPRVSLILVDVGKDAASTVFRDIAPDGTYGGKAGLAVAWDERRAEKIANELTELFGNTTPSTACALERIREIWHSQDWVQIEEEVPEPTFLLVRYDNPRVLEEIQGGVR